MSAVNETLQQLLQRRLLEMGKERGRRESVTLKEVHDALPAQIDGETPATREAVRRVVVGGHTNISGRTARTIATMFDLTESEVLAAAGKRARLQPFTLPEEADRLSERERATVLTVIDTILRAGERQAAAHQPDVDAPSRPRLSVVDGNVAATEVEDDEGELLAAFEDDGAIQDELEGHEDQP